MATRRKVGTQRRRKLAPQQQESVDDDLALAEELIRAARAEQDVVVAEWEKFMKQLGVPDKPIGAKKLRARLIRKGIDPNRNEFSRGIIEMREE